MQANSESLHLKNLILSYIVTSDQDAMRWRWMKSKAFTIFIRLLPRNRVLIKDNLTKRRWASELTCVLCENKLESTAHLFYDYGYNKQNYGAFPSRFLLCSLLFVLLHTPTSKSQSQLYSIFSNCSADPNFTANSAFQSNLNHLLSTLPAATAPSGFYNSTVGQNGGGGEVYGLALCRGDVSSPECSTCLSSAAQYAVTECPRGVSNTVWNDTCMLRYSDSSFFGVVDWTQKFAWNLHNVTDVKLFDDRLDQLMNNLSTAAAYGSGRPPLFAAGQIKFYNFTNIYGLVQCSRDLSRLTATGA
uniref:Gnk2-homologous domain-containing protein n=1 Tax=Ananas comosus var. bracteatus TaxID=296719 RepID=A0A6V7Q3A1_ANACO|nr:unnamed protein product [Ananas comosus var. bracteatus]